MNAADIEIAVVVPLFNKGGTIAEALDSIRSQSHAPSEVIVVDDGSEDDGATRATAAGQGLPGFRLISQQHSGVSVARNRGVAASTAPWVAFLDADDLWRKDHVKELTALVAACPQAVMAGTTFQEIGTTGTLADVNDRPTKRSILGYFRAAATGCVPFFTSTVMVNRHAFECTGGFPRNVSRGEDLVVWSLIAADGPVAISSYVGGYYRRGTSSLTRTLAEPPNKAVETYRAIASRPDLDRDTAEDAGEAANFVALTLAIEAMMGARRTMASLFLAEASDTRIHASRRRLLATINLLPASIAARILNTGSTIRAAMRRPK